MSLLCSNNRFCRKAIKPTVVSYNELCYTQFCNMAFYLSQ